MPPRAQEGLLGDVLGEGGIPDDGAREAADLRLVAADECGCGVRITDVKAGQLSVVRRGAHTPNLGANGRLS